MLQETLKAEIVVAVKSGQETKRDILKLTLSEAQRANKFDDQSIINVMKKLIESNNDVLKHGHNAKLCKENEILKGFLPETISKSQVADLLMPIKEKIRGLKGGQAIGVAIKHLRENGVSFSNNDVNEVVKSIHEE